jgi:ferredoxin-nitrite reductase
MSDTRPVFTREHGPTEVRATVEEQVATHAPNDPWTAIEEKEGPLAVGRMRLMGVYDDRQRDRFMLRIRIPGGRVNADQVDAVAGIIRDFGNGWEGHVEPDRFGEITTRQDIQVHWVQFPALPEIWRRLDAVGMTSAQACGDSMRNPTSCPADGADARGYLSTRPILDEFRTFALHEEKLTAFLPRKWKVVVTGCPTDCAAVKLHCLAFTPARRDGKLGFNVHAGGGLSDSPRIADALDLFVTPERVTDMVRATLQVYCEFGDFDMKAVNRFRVLVHQLGPERVTDELRARLPYEAPGAGESLWTGEFNDHLGVHPDRNGTHYVGLCIPMGRLTVEEWFEVARLARNHGDGGVRMSQRQNLLLTGIRDVDGLLREPFIETYRPEPDPFERAIIACTSAPFCKFAIDDMKTNGRKLVAHLQETLPLAGRDRLEGLRLHMSGCKASCAQVQAAHIGVRATMTKDEEAYEQALDISLGGDLGASRLGQWVRLEESVEDAFDSITEVLRRVCAGELSLDDLTPAGVGRYFEEGNGHG